MLHKVALWSGKCPKNTWFLVFIFLLFPACQFSSNKALEEEKVLMQQHVDSLWVKQKSVQGLFRLRLDELESRKTEMGADLQQLKFANGDWLTAEEKDNIIKWEAMYRIYKGIEGRYKTAVGEGEAQFYTVKSMEKMVKNGSYSGKKEEFKALYQKTNASLAQLLTEAGAIDKEISAIEPTYQRLLEPMAETMDRISTKLGAKIP
jgi:ABC-type Na+ efflux pump permease subunit